MFTESESGSMTEEQYREEFNQELREEEREEMHRTPTPIMAPAFITKVKFLLLSKILLTKI